MFPCCRFCYEKYIDKDASMDREFFKNKIFSNYNVLKRQTNNIIKMNLNEDTKVKVPLDTVLTLVVNGQEHELCTCSCHVKGENVRH